MGIVALAAIIAAVFISRGRSELQRQLSEAQQALASAQSAQAVAESRLGDQLQQLAALKAAHADDRAMLEAKLHEATDENRSQAASIAQLGAQASALATERDGLTGRLAEQKTWFEEQTRAFEQKVVNVTNQLLEEKSQKFTETNRKEIDAVVAPFKEQLGEFRQRVDAIYAADTKDRGQLQEQVAQLARLNQTVSQRAEELTRALTISSKAAGDWGEMILERILEESGLKEGREYTLQHTVVAENEEDLQRPDAVIFLPEQRQVVVDSKVSNKAWTEYCAAADDEARAACLENHLASLRAHIRGLAARDYPHSPDLRTVDFVLMFVPVEAALLTAFAHDDTLYSDAYRSKIILVTPSTLMAVLKLIEGMWLFQKRKESADKIADAGRKLYEKLTTFSDTFLEIGEAIERAHGTFEKAKGQLATGKGNAIRLAQKMVELGVGPAAGKVLPAPLARLAQSEAEAEEQEPVPALAAPLDVETVDGGNG